MSCTLNGCPSNKECQALGHSPRVLLLSDITPGGIRYAQTTWLPSGDAFSVIQRVKPLKLLSGDAFSVRYKSSPYGD